MTDSARIAALETAVRVLQRQARSGAALVRSTAPSIDTGAVQTNQGYLDAVSLRDEMPTLYTYGFSSSLPPGGDKVAVFLNGDRGAAVIVATGHQAHRYGGLATGETVMHDMWGHSIHMTSTGIAIIGNVTVTGNVNVTGDITATGTITGTSGVRDGTGALGALRTAYDVHKHTGVQRGGGTTDTTDTPA